MAIPLSEYTDLGAQKPLNIDQDCAEGIRHSPPLLHRETGGPLIYVKEPLRYTLRALEVFLPLPAPSVTMTSPLFIPPNSNIGPHLAALPPAPPGAARACMSLSSSWRGAGPGQADNPELFFDMARARRGQQAEIMKTRRGAKWAGRSANRYPGPFYSMDWGILQTRNHP